MNIDFVQALRDIEKEKEIPLEKLGQIIEAALESAYRKHYGSAGEIQSPPRMSACAPDIFARSA